MVGKDLIGSRRLSEGRGYTSKTARSRVVDKSIVAGIEDGLSAVMHRFRDSFLGEGINLSEDRVPLRNRPDFASPLVTVFGHTYGLRLVAGRKHSRGAAGPPAIEASVNVYDDEFQIDRFKKDLGHTYEWDQVSRIIANFAMPEDEASIGKDAKQLASLFSFDSDTDVELVEKEREIASVVTGRLVDTILKVRYALEKSQLERCRDRALLVSAVYLYCLRPFAAAYRMSLTTD